MGNKEVFGLSIKLDGGTKFCKYPVNRQKYATMDEAVKAKEDLLAQLSAGARIAYNAIDRKGVDVVAPVIITRMGMGFEVCYYYNGDEDAFLKRFYSFLNSKQLDCNGGNNSFAITKSEGFVTESERRDVVNFLSKEPHLHSVNVSELVALNVEQK